MRKTNSKSELGSMMVEAIAMLGLIAMVTPVLYKKSAERASELQDINTAGEIRAIIKAVDDYVGANYNIIAGKDETTHSVTNSCTPSTVEYESFSPSNDHMAVPIGHFCEFLPYGILNSDGTAKGSKLFSENTQIILKMTGREDTEEGGEGQRVITAFVITEPRNELPVLRASNMSSMIGSNGGYVTNVTGEGEDATGTISGNMGIWNIGDTKADLGVSVKKHAIVAASTAGISAQTATVELNDDSDKYLYRTHDSTDEQRTMEEKLIMGSEDSRNDIVNIGHLAVGAADPNNHALYIAEGDIQIGDATGGGKAPVNISDEGNITVTGNINADADLDIGGTATFGSDDAKITLADGNVGAITGTFTDALSALTGNFGDGAVTINDGEEGDKKTTINQPLLVTAEGTCNGSEGDDCALKVVGDAYIDGDLTITGTFDADHLHANTWLSVGGDRDTPSLLSVKDNKFKFGNASGDNNIIKADAFTNTFDVIASGGATIKANDTNKLEVKNGVTMTGGAATVTAADGNVSATGNTVSMNDTALKVTKTGENNAITSNVTSFQITPTGKESHLTVNNNGTNGELIVNKMDTVFNGDGTHSNVYLRDSVFRLQNDNNKDVVRIGQTADSNAQIDISGYGVTMAEAPEGNKVLRVNLSSNASKSDDNYPIYIRKGAIEMNEGMTYNDKYHRPYIQADKLISNTTVPNLLDDNGDHINNSVHYVVDPAYTSIMHDIKLTTRGGARLSDVLPDFINRGIYVVDNTAPVKGQACSVVDESGNTKTSQGATLEEYFEKTPNGENGKLSVAPCIESEAQVSPWSGFVPIPTCPHGYSAVITVGLANVSMAQAGHLSLTTGNGGSNKHEWKYAVDGSGNIVNKLSIKDLDATAESGMFQGLQANSPWDYDSTDANQPMPLYHQKNTWLKSSISLYPDQKQQNPGSPQGWDVLLGFVYPYTYYQEFLEGIGHSIDETDYQGKGEISIGPGETGDDRIIWNMFPVYAKTIESYATVYCYFNRAGSPCTARDSEGNCTEYGVSYFNSTLVDTNYNQLNNLRERHSKVGANPDYLSRLNNGDADFEGVW